jgi:hypothetical protein
VLEVAVVGRDAGGRGERVGLAQRRVVGLRVDRDARDEQVAARVAQRPRARAQLDRHVAAGVDHRIPAAAGEAPEVGGPVAFDRLDAGRPGRARAAAVEHSDRVAAPHGGVQRRRTEKHATAEDQELHVPMMNHAAHQDGSSPPPGCRNRLTTALNDCAP